MMASPYFFALTSSTMMSRMKLDERGSARGAAASLILEPDVLMASSRVSNPGTSYCFATRPLGTIHLNITSQYFVNQSLVTHVSASGLFPEFLQNARIEPDGDQLARAVAQWRPTNATHRAKLLRRSLRNIRKISPSPCTPPVPCGSPVAR